MAIPSLFPIVQGLEYGLVSTEAKRLEDSVRAGGNHYLTALLQIWQGSKTLAFAEKAVEAAGLPLFSWPEKSVVYLTPVLLAVLKKASFVPEKLQPVLTFFQDHLSTLYQIAAVISSVALLIFGHTFFALSSLLVLGLGVMDRNGWLPLPARQLLHRCSHPLLLVTGLLSGGILDRVFAALNILAWGANLYLSRKKSSENFALQENLTQQKAIDFLQQRFDVKVNQKFIHYNALPPVPNIDIQSFVEQFDQIDWTQHLSTLRQKLKHDARFMERHGNPYQKTEKEIIAITRRSLQTFISTVKERRILVGEPVDYEKLDNYLKIIAKYVEEQNDKIIQTDVLFRLAVEGGEYCGPGKFEAAESIYAQTIGENPEVPFRDKVFSCLQDERNRWMQGFYYKGFTQNAVISGAGQVIDWQDVHNYNLFINLYADQFGLRKAAADNDDTAIVDPLAKWMISHSVEKFIQQEFWRDHDAYDQARVLVNAIGTPQLPQPEFYAFWKNWIERQQIEEFEKAALREELGNGRLFGKPIEIDGEISYDFVILMLLDMGIVEEKTDSLATQSPNKIDLPEYRAVPV